MQRNKVVLVTGATSGVGLAITEQLLALNYTVLATGRNEKQLEKLANVGAKTYVADLSDDVAMQQLIEMLPELDIAILNAGVGTFEYTRAITDEAIEQMMTLNVTVPIKMTKYLLPKVKDQLIYIGSQAGKVATPKAAVYAASKHALIGFTNGLRLEQPTKVVTVIHPGPIDSPFLDLADATNTYRQKMSNVLLTAEEVAKKTIATIGTKKREVNIPWYMGISSKLYGLAPTVVEIIGKPFFNKK